MNALRVPWLLSLVFFFCGAGIAATPTPVVSQNTPMYSIDPNESINRSMFGANVWLVNYVINPTADFLGRVLPDLAKTASHNLYENLVEPEFIVTNVFIGNYPAALVSTKRFLLNTTVGVVGLWDPAQKLGYQRTETEFTESLCVAGLDPGNFVVLPVVGPASSHSAMLLTGFFAVEWYLLAHLSPTLATVDLVVDISASAASLRYARDVPSSDTRDPYWTQRANYQNYLWPRCAPYLEKRIAVHP